MWLEVISSNTPLKSRSASRLQNGLVLGSELCPFEFRNISENGNSTAFLVVLRNREPAMMLNYLLAEEFFLVSNCQVPHGPGFPCGRSTRDSLGSIRAAPGSQHPSHHPRQDSQGAPGAAPTPGIRHLPGDKDSQRPGWAIGPWVRVRIRSGGGTQGQTQSQDG